MYVNPLMARRTKEEAQETRARLLDAAEHVFHEKGVAHASLEDIAAAAEVTRGAVYWHFKDKAELFDAMMQRVVLPMEAIREGADCCEQPDPLSLLRRSAPTMPASTKASGSSPGTSGMRIAFSIGSVTRSIMALNRSALSLKCQ